jgi:hypothetical protein
LARSSLNSFFTVGTRFYISGGKAGKLLSGVGVIFLQQALLKGTKHRSNTKCLNLLNGDAIGIPFWILYGLLPAVVRIAEREIEAT